MQNDGRMEVVKTIGAPGNLRNRFDVGTAAAEVAIGHNRWATHGPVNIPNAHPHTNRSGTVASVCNGTIENYKQLRAELADNGYVFSSQTDTEVIPHLFDYYLADGAEPEEAFRMALGRLTGAYAVLALTDRDPGALYAAKFSSPLVLGINGHEHVAASDTVVFAGTTKQATFLEDHDVVRLSSDRPPRITSVNGFGSIVRIPEDIEDIEKKVSKGEFEHYMLKEIYESADTVRDAIRGRIHPEDNLVKLGGLESVAERLKDTERIIIVACGTSYYAGLIGERLIEEIAGIPVEVEQASEFVYRREPFDKNTAVIAVSQSGETADTIGALKKADELALLKLGIVNSLGSRIYRNTDAGVYCHAGPEIAVASTKAFTSQVTILAEVAMALAEKSNVLNKPLLEELAALPNKIEAMLDDTSSIRAAAKKYVDYKNFLFIGRGYNYPVALEGALKLKEVSYIHAEGYSAGEMKHGPLAMIDEDFPTVAISTDSPQLEKTMSNMEEIRARRGPVLALATTGNEEVGEVANDVIYVPASLEQTQPILNAIALQLFAYYVAVEKGLNVDQPRNLAKSVTVE
jgi:glucosamine--fructose-6-phosphate aminotransferase (isomerizing)